MRFERGAAREVYWIGPSTGFDLGGNASKVFVLVYALADTDGLFQRFPLSTAASITWAGQM